MASVFFTKLVLASNLFTFPARTKRVVDSVNVWPSLCLATYVSFVSIVLIFILLLQQSVSQTSLVR